MRSNGLLVDLSILIKISIMYNNQLRFVSKAVRQTLKQAFLVAFPNITGDIMMQNEMRQDNDYQCPDAIRYYNLSKKEGKVGAINLVEYASKIASSLPQKNGTIDRLEPNDKGFLKIWTSTQLVQNQINAMLLDGIKFPEIKKQKVVVDFSSPNIAKEMHVGHMRSTIIGESICRILQFMGHEVVRTNHVGDWGTQFGMLIAYMRETTPDYDTKLPEVTDLDAYYKAARKRFDSDPDFKKLSQETVVKLQSYDEPTYNAWKKICQVSRQAFARIYERLGISLVEVGQSYYNKMIPKILEELEAKKMIVEDSNTKKKGVEVETKQGDKKKAPKKKEVEEEQEKEEEFEEPQEGKKAKCIFLEGFTNPLIVVKSDGAYNYDSTDVAAISYRLNDLKGDRLIYITDSGQLPHFELIFECARKAGWITDQRIEHMGFGVVLGEDGKKFAARKGQSVKLLDLINQAKEKALQQLKSRQKGVTGEVNQQVKQSTFTSLKPQQYVQAAEKLGIASIKYFDLKQNRKSSYAFDYKKMLDPKGNTAVYLIYAYVRLCSIIRKAGFTTEDLTKLAKETPFKVTHQAERKLASSLVKFIDVVEETAEELAINRLTDFIYDICVLVQQNYKKYRIVGNEHMKTRVLLCEAVRRVLEKAFFMVGIVPLQKI